MNDESRRNRRILIKEEGISMKKVLNTLLVVLVGLLVITSCSIDQNVADELVSVSLRAPGNDRALTADVDFDVTKVSKWYYTATKANGGLSTGQTEGIGLNNAKELNDGKTEALSQGRWNFELFGKTSDGKLICSGSVSNVLITVDSNTVTIKVDPSQTAGINGILIVKDINLLSSDGNTTYDKTSGQYTETITVFKNSDGTAVTLTNDQAEVESGLYRVIVTYTSTADSFTAVTGTKYVNVYDNLTTTVSGTLNEDVAAAQLTAKAGTVEASVAIAADKFDSSTKKNTAAVTVSAASTPSGVTTKTSVTFPATTIQKKDNEEVSLSIASTSIEEASSSFVVSGSTGAVVAGFDFNLTGVESTQFSEPVEIETYIEAGLGSADDLAIEYIGTEVAETENTKPSIVSYDNTTGLLKFKVYHFSKYAVVSKKFVATDELSNLYETLAAAFASNSETIYILSDVTFSESDSWTSLVIKGTSDNIKKLTIEGNGHVISGLNNTLIEHTEYADIVVKNLTLKKSTITTAEDVTATEGIGAYISKMLNSSAEFDNCRLTESAITTTAETRAGGFVGWIGKPQEKNSPITSLTINDCTVDNTTITTYGSIGGFIGHGTQDGWDRNEESITVKNSTVNNCTFSSTEDGIWRVGVVIGTVYRGTTSISDITETGNTLSQKDRYGNEIVGSASQSNLYGRITDSTKYSQFYINGTEITERNKCLASWNGNSSNYLYGKFTDSYFRSSTKNSSEEYDKRTITDRRLDLTTGGLAYYVGTAKTITFSDGNSTTEYYDYEVKAGDVLRMEITISDYSGLHIGGNAFSSKNTVTPGEDGLFMPNGNSGTTTFVVFMEVGEENVKYSYATEGSSNDLQQKTISYTLQDGEAMRYGFTLWATKGYVSQIQIYQVNYKSN